MKYIWSRYIHDIGPNQPYPAWDEYIDVIDTGTVYCRDEYNQTWVEGNCLGSNDMESFSESHIWAVQNGASKWKIYDTTEELLKDFPELFEDLI